MPEWLWSVVVGVVVVGLVAALRAADQKRVDDRFDALWNQIGRDSNAGMRKAFHEIPNLQSHDEYFDRELTKVDERLKRLE